NARSSSSHLSCQMPSRLASGAWMSRVSCASARRSGSGSASAARSRASWRASRIGTTRRSRTIASSSRRRPSLPAPRACRSACNAQTWLAARWPSSNTATVGCALASFGATASASAGATCRIAAASTSPAASSRARDSSVSSSTGCGSRAPAAPTSTASRNIARSGAAIAAQAGASSRAGSSGCRLSGVGGDTVDSGKEFRRHYHLCCYKDFRRAAIFLDRKSTRLNSSHVKISYAVFCLKKKIVIFTPNLPDYPLILVSDRDEPRMRRYCQAYLVTLKVLRHHTACGHERLYNPTLGHDDGIVFGCIDLRRPSAAVGVLPESGGTRIVGAHCTHSRNTRPPHRPVSDGVCNRKLVGTAVFFFYFYGDPQDLHSFPTRRSSD